MQLLRGALGIAIILAICAALSHRRRAISYRVVVWGLLLQAGIGLVVFKSRLGEQFFRWLARLFERFLEFSYQGSQFVFGRLGQKAADDASFSLAFQALPILIYFSAVMAVLYHLGIMQAVIRALARVLGRLLKVSGAEAMVVIADVFVGMTESPLVVRPYIERMTSSELMAMMTGGFATIAGTVLGIYMMFVGADYGVYLIAASVMSAPAALVVAKVLVPETEEPATGSSAELAGSRSGRNLLDAIAIGVRDGLHLALNIAAMLIAFYSLIALINWPLEVWTGWKLQDIFGFLLAPFAWCLGVDWAEAQKFGSLLGIKITLNEWIAYQNLQGMIREAALSDRSIKLATFALCGFANFGSIGIALGGIGQLSPSRREDIARLVLLAMVGGALASCLTAAVAGIFI